MKEFTKILYKFIPIVFMLQAVLRNDPTFFVVAGLYEIAVQISENRETEE